MKLPEGSPTPSPSSPPAVKAQLAGTSASTVTFTPAEAV